MNHYHPYLYSTTPLPQLIHISKPHPHILQLFNCTRALDNLTLQKNYRHVSRMVISHGPATSTASTSRTPTTSLQYAPSSLPYVKSTPGDYKTPRAQFLLHMTCPSKTDRLSSNEFPACSVIRTFGLRIGQHTTWAYYHGLSLCLTLAPSCTRAWPSNLTQSVSNLLPVFGVLFAEHPETLMKNNIVVSLSHCQITFQPYFILTPTPPLILHSFDRFYPSFKLTFISPVLSFMFFIE